VEGTLLLCLGQEHSLELRALLRGGISDVELAVQIRAAIDRKPERHEFLEAPDRLVRVMFRTGGQTKSLTTETQRKTGSCLIFESHPVGNRHRINNPLIF